MAIEQRELLADIPNALGYQRTVETENCGYLVRQYLHSSLYDRISTRPFLDDIEKKWLAFQLLCALRDCHARNVYHGDIKTENILVTSWNWLYVTDFSSAFKKTYLPEDNPADFSYFFDNSGRRTCYLAPERFLSAGEDDDGGGVTWAMDIFSAGCVIAELFVETPIFSLSQLFKYRQGEYSPSAAHLHRIQDVDVREMITHMIQIEPESRYSAEEYLNFWRRKAFPEYFYSFLHQYMGTITDPSSGRRPVLPDTANFGEADDRIDRVYYDFDKISYFLGYDQQSETLQPATSKRTNRSYGEELPVVINIPSNRHVATRFKRSTGDDGTLIFLTLVLSSLRNTARTVCRVRACDLMLAFGERTTDEAKLDRILPYLVVLLTDKSDMVKIAALRSMTQLLALVEVVSPVNAYVFTEYIRPRLSTLIQSPSSNTNPAIRAACASCLASLAHTSLRILEVVQALRADGSIPTLDPETENGTLSNAAYRNIYDVGKAELVEHFESYTKTLLEDPDASVRRAFLGSVSSLCVFFGSPKANDVILSHLNTYLNDKDWMLKCAFLETIVGVATYVGSSSLEEFILPLMLQALTDPEEFVVEKVLRSFANMAELGLFQRSTTWELVDVVGRFTMHPNIWIRESAAHFITATTHFLSAADIHCIIMPLIQPYLRMQLVTITETSLLDALRKPLPRTIVDMAGTWYQKADQGLFWKAPHGQRTFSFGQSDRTLPTISSKDLSPLVMQKIAKNKEDNQWLDRLRNLGMADEDEVKLLALRDYIQRTVSRRAKEDSSQDASHLNSIQKIQDMGLFPTTIFFDSQQAPSAPRKRSTSHTVKQHTITDALLDASKPDDALTFRKQTIANDRKERERRAQDALDVPYTSSRSRRKSSNLSSPLSASPNTRTAAEDQAETDEVARHSARTGTGASLNGDGQSEGTITPTGSADGQKPRVQHRSSAINLISRKGAPKTLAATGTDATNAIGEMDAPHSTSGSPQEHPDPVRGNGTATPEIQAGHSYKGADPHVRGLLDNLASESYQVDEHDFGPLVNPVNRKRKQAESSEPDMPWRPQGVHVATFGEHAGAINRVLPSPDHLFFITASDDGTVRVWDALRLERNLIHKSRQTHRHAEGAQVKCVAFVENTHTFVSCATDGTVNVVKVDCVQSSETMKYGKLRVKRAYKLPGDEFATWCEHFRIDGKSTLLLAIDLRTMATLYTLQVPLQYGIPFTFCLDKKRNWLLLGTSRGVLSLYDIRFRLRIKAWSLSGGTPIRRLFLHPAKGRGKWVCVVGGTSHADITVWDIEKTQCKDVFRASVPAPGNISIPPGAVPLTQSPDTEDFRTLSRTYEPQPITDQDFASPPTYTAEAYSPDASTLRSAVAGSDAGPEDREARYGFVLACGTDRRVRFWDLVRPEASATISGLESDESQPRISSNHPVPGLAVHIERPSSEIRDVGDNARKRERIERAARQKVSRTVQIAREQKSLLRGHLDHVLDVALLEGQSSTMVVSVDRRGCVYVFQ
jgi:phosphoinositide-3-kinase, regulatory subunit 4